jgi:hypothetical protein
MNQNLELEILHSKTQKAVNINSVVWTDYEAISQVIPYPATSLLALTRVSATTSFFRLF